MLADEVAGEVETLLRMGDALARPCSLRRRGISSACVEAMYPTAINPLRDAVLAVRFGRPHPLSDACDLDRDVLISASDAEESERVGLRGVVLYDETIEKAPVVDCEETSPGEVAMGE